MWWSLRDDGGAGGFGSAGEKRIVAPIPANGTSPAMAPSGARKVLLTFVRITNVSKVRMPHRRRVSGALVVDDGMSGVGGAMNCGRGGPCGYGGDAGAF